MYVFGYYISPDTVFTIIATIFVFLTGLGFQLLYKFISKKIYLRKVKKHFLYLLRIYQEKIVNQISSFDDLVEALSKEDSLISLVIESGLTSSALFKFDQHELFLIFHKETKKEAYLFFNLMEGINHISANQKELRVHVDNLQSNLSKHESIWNRGIGELVSYTSNQIISYRSKGVAVDDIKEIDEFLYDYLNLYSKWFESEDTQDRSTTINILINPLKEFLKSNPDRRAVDLLRACRSCDNANLNLNHTKDSYRKVFNNFRNQYSAVHKAIDDFSDQY